MTVINDLISVNDFSDKYPTFTRGTLRAYIFNAKKNGFNEVIRRIGSRVYIKEHLFFEWIEKINNEMNIKKQSQTPKKYYLNLKASTQRDYINFQIEVSEMVGEFIRETNRLNSFKLEVVSCFEKEIEV